MNREVNNMSCAVTREGIMVESLEFSFGGEKFYAERPAVGDGSLFLRSTFVDQQNGGKIQSTSYVIHACGSITYDPETYRATEDVPKLRKAEILAAFIFGQVEQVVDPGGNLADFNRDIDYLT